MSDKTMKIIEYISEDPQNSTLQAISNNTGISKSTVHRIINTLVDDQILAPKPKGGYTLTPKLFAISINGLKQKSALDLAVPLMLSMSLTTRETISFYVRSGAERICIYSAEGEFPWYRLKLGDRSTLLRGSVGIVMAAFISESELERISQIYVQEGKFTPEQLQRALERLPPVRKQGFAVSMGERHHGTASMAVPILDVTGSVTAALSVATNIDRMTPETVQEYSIMLKKAASQICV